MIVALVQMVGAAGGEGGVNQTYIGPALGGNPQRKVYQHEIEIYSPSYLFDAKGAPAKIPDALARGVA